MSEERSVFYIVVHMRDIHIDVCMRGVCWRECTPADHAHNTTLTHTHTRAHIVYYVHKCAYANANEHARALERRANNDDGDVV